MQSAQFAVLMDSLLSQHSSLASYLPVTVMACTVKDGHCVKHMSTTWIVIQTAHERFTNTSKTFPGVMIDKVQKILSEYQEMKLT
jgi:hypothetical protein